MLVNVDRSRSVVLSVLSDFRPKSARDLVEATGLGKRAVYGVLARKRSSSFHSPYMSAINQPLMMHLAIKP